MICKRTLRKKVEAPLLLGKIVQYPQKSNFHIYADVAFNRRNFPLTEMTRLFFSFLRLHYFVSRARRNHPRCSRLTDVPPQAVCWGNAVVKHSTLTLKTHVHSPCALKCALYFCLHMLPFFRDCQKQIHVFFSFCTQAFQALGILNSSQCCLALDAEFVWEDLINRTEVGMHQIPSQKMMTNFNGISQCVLRFLGIVISRRLSGAKF